jgi:apolipoprotein N-acyltransferase
MLLAVVYPFIPILSSIALCISFPPFDLSFLMWVALVPLFLSIADKSARQAFLLSLICGIVFFLGIFNWIFEVPGYMLIHHVLLALYLGSYFGIFGSAFSFISRKCGITTAHFSAPFIWVSLEYIRSNLSFLALPWGLLAHSQYANPLVIQISSVTGAYGISFLIVMVNSALAAVIYPFFLRLKKGNISLYKGPSNIGKITLASTATLLAVFTLGFGHLETSKPIVGQKIKVVAVQGNIEQPKKWDRKYTKFIMETYASLTKEASKYKPSLIVWPEAATPKAINRDPKLYGQLMRITKAAGAYLLLGSSQEPKIGKHDPKQLKYKNTAFLLSSENRKSRTQQYDKICLLPFGEYLPFKERIPWSLIKVTDMGGYAPGNEFTIFKLGAYRFGVTICWENIFPDMARQFVKAGAQFIVNIANEAWFGRTAAPYQFVSMSVFRAVENRVFVVKCANTGISCIIDPCGRIVDYVKDDQGRDIFVQGLLSGSVIPLESKTFYTRYGDWLAWLCISFSIVFILFALLKKGNRSGSS